MKEAELGVTLPQAKNTKGYWEPAEARQKQGPTGRSQCPWYSVKCLWFRCTHQMLNKNKRLGDPWLFPTAQDSSDKVAVGHH